MSVVVLESVSLFLPLPGKIVSAWYNDAPVAQEKEGRGKHVVCHFDVKIIVGHGNAGLDGYITCVISSV